MYNTQQGAFVFRLAPLIEILDFGKDLLIVPNLKAPCENVSPWQDAGIDALSANPLLDAGHDPMRQGLAPCVR